MPPISDGWFLTRERRLGFIKVVKVKPSPLLQLLLRDLDEGEAEAVSLALENKASLLLLDEKEARSIARSYDIRITGVIGILLKAKFENKIPLLKHELDA